MADYEKPMGFTAVNTNGRPSSPPRSHPHPAEQHRPRDSISNPNSTSNSHHNSNSNSHTNSISSTNGVHPPAETRRPTPPNAEDRERERDRGASAHHPSSAERDDPRPESAHPDHNQNHSQSQGQSHSQNQSPTRKRTFPEAFDEATNQQYPPRSAPHRDGPHPPQPTAPAHYDPAHSNSNQYGNGTIQAGSPYSTDPGGLDETDRRTFEALKANSGTNSPPRDPYDARDDDDDQDDSQHGMGMMSAGGTPSNRTAAGVLTKDANKRKRVFSNRTKTGCLTCRKRKKKCDEKHPECNNCMRGGFVCEGYTPRASWQKPINGQQRGPLSLAQIQSKGPGMTPQRQPSLHYPDTPQDFARPDLRHEEPPHRRDMPMGGPPPGLHHHPEGMRQPYPGRDGRYPPAGEMGPRYEQDPRGHQMHNGPIHEPGYPPPPAPSFPSQHAAALHHPSAPQAPMHPDPVTQARAALEHVPSTLPPASTLMGGSPADKQVLTRRPGEPSERDKMLQGDYYLPYTPSLMADRDQCAAAVYRFNQACQNPSLGFAHIDRERLFREIVNLQPNPDQPCAGSPLPPGANEDVITQPGALVPQGRVGPGVVVEAPFQCDYGYNLSIGADVVIGANCRIADTCTVVIGSGTVLSPGVTLMCATYGIDPKERRRGKGRALGRGIVIEEGAWIGTNVTILPGVKVGKCTTIGAGSMIHKDVPPYTVVAGNPPKVVRGIGSDDERDRDRMLMP